ncbi:MAG: TetR/AcrR family transcriptional regulator [Bacillaceae bacterium]|nr:TetR/AcrR family transcriptional regulator [Bacillaceae bacterium]
MSPRKGLDLLKILEAAAEIADQQGLEQVTMASLAKRLGIRSPSLYNHVSNLKDLRSKLAAYSMKKLYHMMSKETVGRAGDDAVHAMGRAYIQFARNHPGLYEATLIAPDHEDQEAQEAGDDIVNLVKQVLEFYRLEGDQVLHAVRVLRSLLHGFASLEQKGGFGLPLDIDQTFEWLLNTFVSGIHQMK